jgi:hypothetical protein
MTGDMNKISKIIYIIHSPLGKRDYKRYGVEIFIKNGFEVQVWDFTPFLYPLIDRLVTPHDPVTNKILIRFDRKSDAIAAIKKEEKGVFFIILFYYRRLAFSVFKSISMKNIPYGMVVANGIPTGRGNRSTKELFKKIMRLTPKKLIDRFFVRILPALSGIRGATFAFAGGAKSPTKMTLIGHNTEMIWIHAFDYDDYLENKNGEQNEEKIAVFLDEDYVFHSDYIHLDMAAPTSAEEYFPLLCKFFDYVEEKLDLEVVIAAHPRSHYEELPDFFQGRKVIRGKSSGLVRKAKLVIMQDSTSINFPVLYKKPMIFITTDNIETTIYGKIIADFASYFKKTPINISRKVNIDLEDELSVYEEGYAKYKHDFIKIEGTDELPFWQVVSNKIKELNV